MLFLNLQQLWPQYAVFMFLLAQLLPEFGVFRPSNPPLTAKNWKKSKKQNSWHRSIDSNPISGRFVSYV